MAFNFSEAGELIEKPNAQAGGFHFNEDGTEIEAAPKEQVEPPKRGFTDVIKDVGVSFAGGANALLETGGNLAGLVGAADMDNWAARQGESGKKYWDEQKSSGLKADEAERRAAIDSADGQWSKAGTAFWETVKNPALLSSFAAEQVPMFLPIGMAGRAGSVVSLATGAAGKTASVAGKVAGKVGAEGIAARIAQKGLAGISTAEKAAGAIGTTTGIGAGALLQGADVGGDTYNDVLKLPQSLWEHNADYQSLRMQVGDQPAKEAIAHDLAQQAATEGGVASVLTNLLPFARTFERATAGAPTKLKGNIVARGIKGFAGESLQEASEEGWGKVASNRAAQEIDASRGLEEGVGEAAGMGAVGGGVMGGVMGMASKDTASNQPAADIPPGAPPIPGNIPDGSIQAEAPESDTLPESQDIADTALVVDDLIDAEADAQIEVVTNDAITATQATHDALEAKKTPSNPLTNASIAAQQHGVDMATSADISAAEQLVRTKQVQAWSNDRLGAFITGATINQNRTPSQEFMLAMSLEEQQRRNVPLQNTPETQAIAPTIAKNTAVNGAEGMSNGAINVASPPELAPVSVEGGSIDPATGGTNGLLQSPLGAGTGRDGMPRTLVETDASGGTSPGGVRTDAVAPAQPVGLAEGVAVDENYAKWFDGVGKKLQQEGWAQDVLDTMQESGESPQAIAETFWAKTYPSMPQQGKDLFGRLYKGHTGQALQDGANPLDMIDLGDSAGYLEGTDRGFVALMREASNQSVRNKIEQGSVDGEVLAKQIAPPRPEAQQPAPQTPAPFDASVPAGKIVRTNNGKLAFSGYTKQQIQDAVDNIHSIAVAKAAKTTKNKSPNEIKAALFKAEFKPKIHDADGKGQILVEARKGQAVIPMLKDHENALRTALEQSAPSTKKPQKASTDLLQRIKQLGGIDGTLALDITGEKRAPGGWKFVFKKGGTGLDDLATMLSSDGFMIDTGDVDGGVQQLRDMIRSHIGGERNFKAQTQEAQAEAMARDQDLNALAQRADELGINWKNLNAQQLSDAVYEAEDALEMERLDAEELSDATIAASDEGVDEDVEIAFGDEAVTDNAALQAWLGEDDEQTTGGNTTEGAGTRAQEDAGINGGTDRQEAGTGQEVLQSYTNQEVLDAEARREQAGREFGENSKQAAAPVGDLFSKTGDGTKVAPITVEHHDHVKQAEQRVNTNPTDAQKEAGNYQKAHVQWNGLDITIENPQGSIRSGKDANGKAWEVTMPATYGYIKRTEGADGEHIDVYLGKHLQNQTVYVIDQIDLKTGKFDEHKNMLGFATLREAERIYKLGFSDGKGKHRLGATTPMTLEKFKEWIKTEDTTKPVAESLLTSYTQEDIAKREQAASDRDRFTLERLNRDTDQMEPVTFERGEYVRYLLSGDHHANGEIDGISQARREFSVDGLWYPFGAAYKADKPAEPVKLTVPLSSVIDAANAKHGADLNYAARIHTTVVHKSLFDRIHEGEVSADEFKAAFAAVLANKDGIVAELEAMTKPEIFKRFPGLEYRYKSEKKADGIEAAYRDMISDFTLGKSYSYGMGKDSMVNSIRALVENTTDESLAEFADGIKKGREERETRRKDALAGMDNPQTLEDYQRILSARAQEIGEGATFAQARMAMDMEQRAKFDELAAEKSRSERASRKVVQQEQSLRAPGEAVETTEIIKTKHTKHGHDLWQFQMVQRVAPEEFKSLATQAKRLGGDYSSYRGNGAIPGWQFRTEEAAKAFKALVAGDTAHAKDVMSVRRDAFADDRSQSAVERLTEMADALEEKADTSLNQERKENTNRRAEMAARAETAARSDKALAQTMRNIAQAIQDGSAKFLDRIRQKVQVETLRGFAHTAQADMLRQKYPTYAEQEKHRDATITAEAADYATYPTYTAFRSDLANIGRALLEVDGTKKLGQQIMKVANDVSDAYLSFAKENLHKVSTFSKTGGGGAVFASKAEAEAVIARSGFNGQAIVLPFKRGQNIIIQSPSEAINRGIWQGDNDKRITLHPDIGAELVEKMGKAARRGVKISVPWQLENAYDSRKRLDGMDIETPAELRAALREFIGLREAPKEADKIKQLERAMIGHRNDGMDFFPTPAGVADEMVEAADIQEGMSVLEPSAGMGHIADRIREAGVEPDVVELAVDRRELLEAKGYNLVGSDFMDTDGKYDRIIMNPPFGDRRDAEHVQHAYDMLKPSGRLVAIMGEGVFFGNDSKAQAFRDWLDQVGGTSEKLAEGTFLDPSLPVNTGVAARMVVITKDTDNGVAMFSKAQVSSALKPNRSEAESFRASLDSAMSSLKSVVSPITVGSTPAVLQEIGASNLPVQVSRDVVRKATNGVRHHISMDAIRALPEELANPVMVFKSASEENSLVVLTEMMDENGAPVIAAVHLSAKEGRQTVNRIGSIYGKEEIGAIESWINKGYLLYQNQEKSLDWVRRSGLQLPKGGSLSQGSGATVKTEQDIVNGLHSFAGASNATPQTIESVRQATAKLRASWHGFKQVRIVQSVKEIPNELYLRALRAARPIAQDSEGIYDPKTRTVYLIADNLASPERAVWVAIHEVTGHGGIRMLGSPVVDALNFAAKNGFVAKLAQAIAADRGETFDAKTHTDEAIAELAAATITGNVDAIMERYGVKVPMGMRSNLLGMIKRVVDAVRQFIGRVTGKPVEEVSDGDVLGLIRKMKNAVEGVDQGYDTAGVSNGVLASKSGAVAARSVGFGKDAALVADFRNDQPLKRHADYKAAKAGDIAAAVRLVSALVKPESIAAAKEKFGDDVAYLPVMAQEASGKNQIPNALAIHYAAKAGGTLATSIFQTNKAYHTGADAMERMIARSEFGGEVVRGQKYVLVDDVSTMGGTLADLASYIQANGGVVSGAVLLTNASRTGTITPDAKIIRSLGERHGQAIKQLFGIEPSALTSDESQYLIGFRTTDELRNRAATASAERGRRIRSKDVSEPQDSATLDRSEPLASRPAQQPIPGAAQPPAQPPRQGKMPLQGGQPGNRASWDSPEPSTFDDLVYKLQDKNIDLKRVLQAIRETGAQVAEQQNAYLQEELFHGRAAKRSQDFVNTELKPMMIEMAQRGMKQEELDAYLHARHAKEANALIASRDPNMPDGGSGMTNKEADDYFANLPELKRKQLEATARRVDAILAKTREYYASYGLVSRDTVDGWAQMFKHYVPLMREDHDGGMGIGQGFSIKGKEVKHRTGSTAKVVDILANIAMQREKAIVRGEKNRVAVALAGLAKLNPNPDFWSFDKPPTERVLNEKTGLVEERIDPTFRSKPNVVVAKIKDSNGQVHERAVIFNEHDERAVRMAEAMKNLDATQLSGLLGVSAKITRYFASINTQYNPVFGVTNLVRDVQGMALNLSSTPLAGHKMAVLKKIPAALAGIYADARAERKGSPATSKVAQDWEELQDSGGMTGYRDLYRNSGDRAKAIEHELDPHNWVNSKWGKVFTAGGMLKVPLTTAQDMASPLFDWLSDYNTMMEGATRLAIYQTARELGLSKQASGSLSKNTTVNFNRKGQSGQQAGALYAFFNAAMQGSARIGETVFDMEKGDIKTLRLSKTGQKIVAGGVLLGVMQALALAAAGFDDDEPPEFLRERNLIIPIGGKKYVSIPMPLGFHALPNIGRISTEYALGGFKKPVDHVVRLVGVFAEAFNPMGSAGISMQTIAPTALDPFAALEANKDWTGKTIYKEDFNSMKPTPGFTRNKDTASAWSKFLAEGINYVTGGTDYTPGAFSPTADQIDYLIGQVTGGVGRETSKLAQTGQAIYTGEDLPTYKMPLVGRFYGNLENQSSQGAKYYANLKEINAIDSELTGRRKDDLPTDDFENENPEYELIGMAKGTDNKIRMLRRRKTKLISEGASRADIREVEVEITEAMRELNDAVRELRATATP